MNQFRFLAAFLAGRSLEIAEAADGVSAHTNGHVVFVSAGSPVAQQRREIVLQSALLGAGSLEAHLMRPLRARPALARRYLALEGRRVLADVAERLPLAARDTTRRPVHHVQRGIARDGQGPREDRRCAGMVRHHTTIAAPEEKSRASGPRPPTPIYGWSSSTSSTPRKMATATRRAKKARSSSCSRTR